MLRKKNPKIRNTSIQDPFGRVSIHNKIKQQSTKMSVYFKKLPQNPKHCVSRVLSCSSWSSKHRFTGTNHTDRERHRDTNHSYALLHQYSQSVWDSQHSPRQQVPENWSHLDYVQGKTPTTLIPNKLMNLKAIHYVYREDACMHSVIVHNIYTYTYKKPQTPS